MNRAAIRAALIQHADQGDAGANLDHISGEIAVAAAKGAQLVLLQELHNSRYFCQTEDNACFDLAEDIPGPSTDMLSAVARQHGIVIVASLFERRAPGLYHNTAVVLDSDGGLAGRYRKMHVPEDPGFHEKYYFTPGDQGFLPIDTAVGRLGVMICWDQWFPEAARLMTLAGADLLLYPTAIGWDMREAQRDRDQQRDAWLTVQRGHAIANGLPVLCCNRVGFEASPRQGDPGIRFWGGSFVCGPLGEMLALAGEETETLVAEIDLARSERIRQTWPFLRDRRIDAYRDLEQRLRERSPP